MKKFQSGPDMNRLALLGNHQMSSDPHLLSENTNF